MKKLISLLLSLTVPLCLCPAVLADGEQTEEETPVYTAEEVLYAVLDYDGEVDDLYAVVILNSKKDCDATVYGPFSDVKNLTDTREIKAGKGKVSLEAPEGRFFFQSTLSDRMLPWKTEIGYTLDGREVAPDELGGRSGQLGINISVGDGGMKDSSFYDGFMVQVSITLDSGLCSNIEAEGATIANSGADKLVNFTVMPGTEAEFSLTADVVNFSMPGITFSAVPFSMGDSLGSMTEMIDGLKQLSGAISQLSDGASQLSGGAGQLCDGAWMFGQGLYQLSANSASLVSASEMFLNMFRMFKEALIAVSGLPDPGDVSDLASLIAAMDELCATLDSAAAEMEQSAARLETARANIDAAFAGVPDSAEADAAYVAAAAEALPEEVICALLEAYGEDGYAGGMAALRNVIAAANAAVSAKGQWQQIQPDYDNAVQTMHELAAYMENLSTSVRRLRDVMDGMSGTGARDQLDELIMKATELASGYEMFHEGLVAYTGGVDALADNWGSLYDGIVQLTGGTEQLSDGTRQLNDGTKDIPDTIDDMLAAYTGSDYSDHSFLSEKNGSTQSVQFVLTTRAIEPQDDGGAGDGANDLPSALIQFWERLIALFE